MLSSKNEITNFEKILQKYKFINKYNLILKDAVWVDILFKSNINEKIINDNISDLYYFRDIKTQESWFKLWHFHELEEQEFNSILKDVALKFNNNYYVEHAEILHVIAILLNLSKEKLYNKTQENILKQAKQNIHQCMKTRRWKEKEFYGDEFEERYSLGYMDKESKHFLNIYKYMTEKSRLAFENDLPNKANNLLDYFKNNNFDRINDKLTNKFRNKAIFLHIEKDKFIEIIIKIQNKELFKISRILELRYEKFNLLNNNELRKEKDFWIYIFENLLRYVNKETQQLKYYLINNFIEYRIEKIINNFNETINDV